MTVRRIGEEVNWFQVGATVIPLIVAALLGWMTIEKRLAVVEDRIASHIASPGHAQTLDRVGRVETLSAVSDKGAEEILRRLDDIAKRLERIERAQ